jgi:ribosomal protein S18 acetylase RimI-like enzyme
MSNEFSISPAESRTFQLQIYRAKVSDWDSDFMASWGNTEQVDLVISRVDTNLQSSLFQLYELYPKSILADTLVYYGGSVRKKARPALPENVAIIRGGKEHQGLLEGLILDIFKGYQNHYHSNPLFRTVDLAKGYLEWCTPFLVDEDKICLFLLENGIPAGFLAAKLFPGKKAYADIILNGVLKSFEGRGYYSYLLRELMAFLSESGFEEVVVSTQLNNQRVQSVWAKEGLGLKQSFYTFHHFISDKAKDALKKISS